MAAMPNPQSMSLYTVFLRVARDSSFTAAARTLGYTQSAVSRQIQTLEDEWGVPLFDRLPRGVRLTEAGRVLLPHAEAVEARLATARAEIEALRTLAAGRLRIGAFATADAQLLPSALAAFRARHPGVRVTRAEGLSAGLLQLLTAGELDLAVVTAPEGAPDGVELHHLLDERMYVALPRSHPLAGRTDVRLAELADEEWIAGSTRPEQTLMRTAVADGFRPRPGFVVAEWIAKQGFVAAGLGVTLVPALAACAARPDLALVALHPDDAPWRAVYAATPRGPAPTPAVAAFLALLRQAAGRLAS
ncbi:LysR family transcriptional regulator [Streptomyces antimicrobicus]|uniref:LysR family transcriptional regulator n=1 Tax=Streptomyces antimicrobicus TaxID=2883108 RepID=A0ABS8B8J1_9ACTN|nr:LysR family transcriptional regulator [Streptomyces antimicrobicus]MCB5180936.1 LysR family transcriptional regulator [Streptomyces antimicrobicus]